jgi:chromosome segregation ATPase
MMGAYTNMNQAGLGHMGNYHDRGNTSDDATSFGLSELQKQIDKLKRDAKAQKEADEGARSQMLKVAEEAASHRASLQRKESEVEDLKKAIKEVKEKADRELEEIREREKISIREIAILQAKLNEQTRLQVENAEKKLAERSEDLERHHEALEKLEQSNNMKLQKCVSK